MFRILGLGSLMGVQSMYIAVYPIINLVSQEGRTKTDRKKMSSNYRQSHVLRPPFKKAFGSIDYIRNFRMFSPKSIFMDKSNYQADA